MTKPDTSSFAMRPAVLADLEALTAIDIRCFPRGIAYPKEELAFLLKSRAALTLVAERSGVIAGFASMRRLPQGSSRPQTLRGELITIDVLPEFRRSHIASQLYQTLEDWLRAAGGSAIELHVAVDNTAALRLYERLGYRIVAQVPRYYAQKFDAWWMKKVL